MVAKVTLLDLQLGAESDPKLRRLAEEMRRLQQTVNALVERSQAISPSLSGGAALAPDQWDVVLIPGSPPQFVIRYNEGGIIRTGAIILS